MLGEDEIISRFVHRGLDEATVAAIGELPRGKGLLGLLIRDPRIVRTDDIAAHPASYGFPPNRPPMHSFLEVPVRSRGRVYSNLYLTEKPGGFDARDEELIAVLAVQAGTAIENAELAERLQSMAVADERDRISRELHDGVIQALFSIGMGLERGLTELAREHEVNAVVRPRLDVQAGIGAGVPEALVPDLLQVVREALSNVAKHAEAGR